MNTNTDGVSAMSAELKRRDPERAAFESWFCKTYHESCLAPTENGCYLNRSAGMAWDAWQAARPKRSAIGRLINLAADCALRKPLRSLAPLTEATHIGHRQFGRAYDQADDALAALSQELRAAIDAL